MSVTGDYLLSGESGRIGDVDEEPLARTVRFRLDWWEVILDQTVTGPYFWEGKGYGYNLVNDYPPASDAPDLRSPHNATMTILARSGVPGLVLWIAFLASVYVALARTWLAKRSSDGQSRARLSAWIAVYLLAFLFNSSFDVFLEGPMGGVWFWFLIGIAWQITVDHDRQEAPIEKSPSQNEAPASA